VIAAEYDKGALCCRPTDLVVQQTNKNDSPMIDYPFVLRSRSMSRRRVLVLGGSITASALAGLSPRSAQAVLRLDINQGNPQPMPGCSRRLIPRHSSRKP
jgi:hypothetical protein